MKIDNFFEDSYFVDLEIFTVLLQKFINDC